VRAVPIWPLGSAASVLNSEGRTSRTDFSLSLWSSVCVCVCGSCAAGRRIDAPPGHAPCAPAAWRPAVGAVHEVSLAAPAEPTHTTQTAWRPARAR
jgi:hypothetical protein